MRRYFFQTIFQMALIFLIVVLGIIGSEYVFDTYHPGWLGFTLSPLFVALSIDIFLVSMWQGSNSMDLEK